MLTEVPESSVTKYIVKVRGVAVCQPQATKRLAESFILHLPPEAQAVAEIVPVIEGGKQVLFG